MINSRFNQVPGWRKSSHSDDQKLGCCVELTRLGVIQNGAVGLRDNQLDDGPVIAVRSAGAEAMIAAIKAGRFDLAG